jgi:acetyltransferase-like isoleucine patch superfamily enzyme
MISILKKLVVLIKELDFRFIKNKSIVRAQFGSSMSIPNNVKILNSRITVLNGGYLSIDDNCTIENVDMHISGKVIIGIHNIFSGDKSTRTSITVGQGEFIIGSYNRLKCRIMVRFGGNLKIGNHNNINDRSEIRCDESVTIGDYNQISYDCTMWDTNTHNIYDDAKRRELTDKYYPIFGYEYERPKTKPIVVENDCWIGKDCSILKGVVLRSSCIIGYRATLSNCEINSGKVLVPNIEYKVFDRK